MSVYTGAGARKTPRHILELMEGAAYVMAEQGHTLRGGHAPGADQAFEEGARKARGYAEIYLPWPGYESDVPVWQLKLDRPKPEAFTIAREFHPAWSQLSSGAKALHARNAHELLGEDLLTPSRFLLCWTPAGRAVGGTGGAIRIAEHWGIEVFNLAMASARDRLEALVKQAA